MYPSFPELFNMAGYFLYHNLEEGRENKVCLYYEDREWTYSEVARLSNQTGNALRELGAGLEDRVLLVLPDCPEFVWTWFGAAREGQVTGPLGRRGLARERDGDRSQPQWLLRTHRRQR